MSDEQIENLDSTNETEETVIPEDTTGEETLDTESEVDVAQLQATNKKLFERAKKAEADLKLLKKQPKPVQQASPANVEETVLLAQGFNEELMENLKKVSQVQGISLIKAQNDPIFVAIKEKFEKDKKVEQASMPASRGSGQAKPKKDFTTPGLSREEHMAMVNNL